MKQTVEKSKQTVWLFTMLTVMVVLSAYYLVSDPMVNDSFVNSNNAFDNSSETNIDINTEDVLNNLDLLDQIGTNTSDLFIGLKLERTNSREKQLDQLYSMMNNDITEETIAGLQGKIENLLTTEEAELVLEKLIIADGYNDAVVLSNNNNVDVIIQTEALSKAEAVKIIKMVSDRLDIPAVNIHIKTVK